MIFHEALKGIVISIMVTVTLLFVVIATFGLVVDPVLRYVTVDAALGQLEPDNMALAKLKGITLGVDLAKGLLSILSLIPAVRGIFKFYKEVSK